MGVRIILPVETNHVFIDPSPLGVDIWALCDRAQEIGIRMSGSRIIVHVQITEDAVEDLLALVAKMKAEAQRDGKVPGQNPAWSQEGAKHIAGELWEGLAHGNVQVARKGVKYSGN